MGLQSDYRRLRSRLRKQMDFAARRELDPMDPAGGQLEARLDRGVENPPRTPRSGKPGGFLCKDRSAKRKDDPKWVCLRMLCTPLNPMVLLIRQSLLNGYFIGNIPYFQRNPNEDFTVNQPS